jgi:hypothetical protein
MILLKALSSQSFNSNEDVHEARLVIEITGTISSVEPNVDAPLWTHPWEGPVLRDSQHDL